MIYDQTVLILGAGASVPYGLPTGMELRAKILDLLVQESFLMMCSMKGIEKHRVDEFSSAFTMSGTNSIDEFLEFRTEFLELGKMAITVVLTDCENEHELHNGTGDWYRYLFGKMSTSFEEFSRNKLSILTFNYDRSFEHFLFTALKNTYGKSDDECKSAIDSIPIIHLHGSIGRLPWQGGDRPYEAMNSVSLSRSKFALQWLQEGNDGIKIIHEGSVKPSAEFTSAHGLLHQASRIYFLGFGYHRISIPRLQINNLNKSQLKQATGTSYGLTDVERSNIQERLLMNKFHLSLPGVRGQKILEFLRENVTLE